MRISFKNIVLQSCFTFINLCLCTPLVVQNNKSHLPAIPDLSDLSGGLSNPYYFNFISYILWKVIAQRLRGPAERSAFGAAYGRELLSQVWPEAEALAASLAVTGRAASSTIPPPLSPLAFFKSETLDRPPASLPPNASNTTLLGLLAELLDKLESQGYMCR